MIDRFTDSTIAYQHYGFGVNLKLIKMINLYLLKDFKVSFTFLNIVNKKNMMQRLKSRKILNRYDRFDNTFYQRVQEGFLKLKKKNNKRYLVIDSNLNINKNKNFIINKVKEII